MLKCLRYLHSSKKMKGSKSKQINIMLKCLSYVLSSKTVNEKSEVKVKARFNAEMFQIYKKF